MVSVPINSSTPTITTFIVHCTWNILLFPGVVSPVDVTSTDTIESVSCVDLKLVITGLLAGVELGDVDSCSSLFCVSFWQINVTRTLVIVPETGVELQATVSGVPVVPDVVVVLLSFTAPRSN